MTFTQRIKCFPPILVRLLAMQGNKPMTAAVIIARSFAGHTWDVTTNDCLNPFEVENISRCTTWKGIGVTQCLAFLHGCGMDFDDTQQMRKVDDYLRKRPTFAYLRKSPDWETLYRPLLIQWRNIYPCNVSPTDMPHPHLRQVLQRLTPLHHGYKK